MKRFRILADDFQCPWSPSDWYCKGLSYRADPSCHPDLPAYAEKLVKEGKAEWDDTGRLVSGSGVVK